MRQELTNNVPGLNVDVYFGDAERPLPNWRGILIQEDEDTDELSSEERDSVIGMIGFDPLEYEEQKDADMSDKSATGISMLTVKPSPLKYRTKSIPAHEDANPYQDKGCPLCGKHAVGSCRCSGPHSLEQLEKGHGLKCPNGHRFSHDSKLVFDPTKGKFLPNYGKKDGNPSVVPNAPKPQGPNEPGFTGNIEDSLGRNRCYKDGVPVPCNNMDDSGVSDSQTGEQSDNGGEHDHKEEGRDYSEVPQGEKIAKAPCCLYTPDPSQPNPETGVAESRIGVPAMQVPPPPKEIPRLPNLTERERKAESDFADYFLNNPDGAVNAYMERKNEVVGQDDKGNPKYAIGDAPNIFNTDDAKLLSPDYNPQSGDPEEVKNARGVFNLAVHQTANAIAKKAFVSYLDGDEFKNLPDEKKFVLVTAGGVAAGKGYALSKSPETAAMQNIAGAVWDAAGEQNAAENPWILEECRKRGIKAKFAFIHANPIQTWENPERGVVQRANNIGRMVDARVFSDSYSLGAKNFKKFMDENTGSDDADFYIINNATGGEPQMVDSFPEESLSVDGEALYARASAVLQERASQLRPAVVRGGSLGQRVWGKAKATTEGKSLLHKRTKILQGHIRMKAMKDKDEIAEALLKNIKWNNENWAEEDKEGFERSLHCKPFDYSNQGNEQSQPKEEKSNDRMPKVDVKKSPFGKKS